MKKVLIHTMIAINIIYSIIISLLLLSEFAGFDIRVQSLKSLVYFGTLIGTPVMIVLNTSLKRISLLAYPMVMLVLIIVINPFRILYRSSVWETVNVLYEHKYCFFRTVEFQMQDIGARGFNRRTVEVISLTPFFAITRDAASDIAEDTGWLDVSFYSVK